MRPQGSQSSSSASITAAAAPTLAAPIVDTAAGQGVPKGGDSSAVPSSPGQGTLPAPPLPSPAAVSPPAAEDEGSGLESGGEGNDEFNGEAGQSNAQGEEEAEAPDPARLDQALALIQSEMDNYNYSAKPEFILVVEWQELT